MTAGYNPAVSKYVATIAILIAVCACDSRSKKKRTEYQKRTRSVLEELAPLGFKIDERKLQIDFGNVSRARSDLDRQQDMFFRPAHFDAFYQVQLLLGANLTVKSPKELRRALVNQFATHVPAYYQPDRNALVFMDNWRASLGESDTLVAHELGHAHQDLVLGGYKSFLSRHRERLDLSRVASCLGEGYAEIVALTVMAARQGKSIESIDPSTFDGGTERLINGEAYRIAYDCGRKYMLARFKEGGMEAVRKALIDTPTSSEQVLHARKLGVDLPTTVEIPSWPSTEGQATLIYDDVVGEMSIYMLFADDRGVPTAYLAATGWDGDRLHLYETERYGRVLLWRSVWDRPEDARQFLRLLPAGTAEARATGNEVRIVHCSEGRDKCPSYDTVYASVSPIAVPGAADAASTAAEEAAFAAQQKAQGAENEGRFVVAKHGVSLPVPEGWNVTLVKNVAALMSAPEDGFSDNVMVSSTPPTVAKNLDAFSKVLSGELKRMKMKLVASERITRSGHTMLRFEYFGAWPGAQFDNHFVQLTFERAGYFVSVTATVLSKRWQRVKPTVEAVLSDLRVVASGDAE